jgi:beta-galactosidase
MKFTSFAAFGALLLVGSVCAFAGRETSELAAGWKFTEGDPGLAATTGTWDAVSVPHTWNAKDGQPDRFPIGQKSSYYRGVGWYERTLKIPAGWQGKRVFVRFQAAALTATVYINGEELGGHRGGFTAFCFELTPHLHFGASNELRVRVDNSIQQDVAPLSGDFNVDGGLYRPVELIVTDEVCISPLDHASPGVYLTTKSLDQTKGDVEVKAVLSDGGTAERKVTVDASIANAAGSIVSKGEQAIEVFPGEAGLATLDLSVANPHLWQGRADPYLYTVTVRLKRDGHVVDTVSQPLGLRTVAISEPQGFLLNGQPYAIHGVNRHQDFASKGWAAAASDHAADARDMLEMGVTAVRLTHYPQSEALHDICDRNGLLLWNEISLVDLIDGSPAFADNAEEQMREMILQRYNHPSAVFWGLFNELENRKTPPPDALLRRLMGVIDGLDPSRIDVAATDHDNRSYNKIPPAICFNRYPGWYGSGHPDDLAGMIDKAYAEIGHRIGISEYGAGANPAQHVEGAPQKVDPKGQFHPEEWQATVHEREWAILQDNPKLWGTFLWVMYDFPSATRSEGSHSGLNDKGMITQDRKTKKDVFYFYKANWNPAPMVYLTGKRLTVRHLPVMEVKAYSNAPEVELWVNGKSVGTAKPDSVKIVRWPNVALRPGANRIEAIAHAGNKTLKDSCDWNLAPDSSATGAGTP